MKDFASSTTTLDLTHAAKKHPKLGPHHVGTFPLDALPSLTITRRPCHLIYNLSRSSEPPGSHWVSIWLSNQGTAEVVDSFGRRPKSREVLTFLRRHARIRLYSSQQIQSLGSDSCGLFCLSHGLARARGVPLHSWLARFGRHLQTNDALVQCEFMKELAYPALFSVRIRNWRQEVQRACHPVSRRSAAARSSCAPKPRASR